MRKDTFFPSTFLRVFFCPLRSVNREDPVQQSFIFHLIPSRFSASCQSRHIIATKQDSDVFYPLFPPPSLLTAGHVGVLGEALWIIYSQRSLESTPSNFVEYPRFSTRPHGAFLSLAHPFYATCSARERRLGFHGCLRWAAEKTWETGKTRSP